MGRGRELESTSGERNGDRYLSSCLDSGCPGSLLAPADPRHGKEIRLKNCQERNQKHKAHYCPGPRTGLSVALVGRTGHQDEMMAAWMTVEAENGEKWIDPVIQDSDPRAEFMTMVAIWAVDRYLVFSFRGTRWDDAALPIWTCARPYELLWPMKCDRSFEIAPSAPYFPLYLEEVASPWEGPRVALLNRHIPRAGDMLHKGKSNFVSGSLRYSAMGMCLLLQHNQLYPE